MHSSRTQPLTQLNKIFQSTNLLILRRDPVRMPHSIPVGEAVIDIGHMSTRNKDLQLLLISLLSNNPGDNSAEAAQEDVEGVPTPVFLSRVHLNRINDNYCSDPACVKTVTKQLDLMSNPV